MAQIRQLGTALSGSTTGTDDREQHQGTGSPEGVVAGDIGDLYRDITPAAALIYLKTAGNNLSTGWEAVATEVPVSLTSIEDGAASVVCTDPDVAVTGDEILIAATTLGFYDHAAAAQHAAIADATTAVDIIPLFNTLLAAMRAVGLIDT